MWLRVCIKLWDRHVKQKVLTLGALCHVVMMPLNSPGIISAPSVNPDFLKSISDSVISVALLLHYLFMLWIMRAQEKKPHDAALQLQTSQSVATPWMNPLLTALSSSERKCKENLTAVIPSQTCLSSQQTSVTVFLKTSYQRCFFSA